MFSRQVFQMEHVTSGASRRQRRKMSQSVPPRDLTQQRIRSIKQRQHLRYVQPSSISDGTSPIRFQRRKMSQSVPPW
ncbi:hypothetical protein CEXT_246301 [Caerostris extrusa]|uniref:Uncharacterized protein n=1 Tax=Caerostris extrusa TaxID=172846 RepID=A0AAV4RAA6_CAEEX|nr:hypothetical protein CEXT_246301 [Caerostris extrusa]